MKKLLLILLLLCLLGGCAADPSAVPHYPPMPAKNDTTNYENNPLDSGSGWYGSFPSGLRPVLLVNGRLYRYGGDSSRSSANGAVAGDTSDSPAGQNWADYTADTFLPEGFTLAGEISGITEEVPTQELQLRAAFSATGTVYTNPDVPEVVYALITTANIGPSYWRFVTDALGDHERILYQGRWYRFRADLNEICPRIETLPEGCVPVGNLTFVGYNQIPQNHLETNVPNDAFGYSLHGRQVYAVPGDDSKLYVYEHRYWAKGDNPAWRVCSLMNE